MSVLTGTISPYGPLIHFMAMQSRERVEALLPWHRRSSYEPDAPARGVPPSPRWRIGLVCARMRNFLAGVIKKAGISFSSPVVGMGLLDTERVVPRSIELSSRVWAYRLGALSRFTRRPLGRLSKRVTSLMHASYSVRRCPPP